jgi:hypothetical protein
VKEGLPEDVTREQVLYHVTRLRESCELLRTLDSGDYPLALYSSGETQVKKNAKGQTLVDKDRQVIMEPVALPIFGTTPRDTHCLRFAVTQAIFSDLSLLSEWGGHDDALAMIDEARLFPRKAVVYEARRR